MADLISYLSNLICKWRGKPQCGSDVEELRNLFKARYHSFKLLLSANNRSLEIMADLEEALRGARSFGMSFVKANCTAVSVNVYRMIKSLDDLAPGKYGKLYERFNEIEERINQTLSQKRIFRGEKLVIPLAEINREMADQVGSKMANLGEIKNRIKVTVPEGFVVTSLAYEKFLEHNDLQSEIDRLLQSLSMERMDELYLLSTRLQQLIIQAEVPEDLQKAMTAAYEEIALGPSARVSLRSSALGEDGTGTSFAGQYRSELNINSENIFEVYKEIVASKYSPPALTYRLARGIRDEDIAMCVGCMTMVEASAGGVIYSRNPINIRDHTIRIHSAYGLPKSVVDGSVDADLFIVSRDAPMKIVDKKIGKKDRIFLCDPEEGVCRLEVTPHESIVPSISQDQVFALAVMAVELDDYYGSPQDIEWAIKTDGTICLLQCRPLEQIDSGERTLRVEEEVSEAGQVILRGGTTASSGVNCGPVFHLVKSADTLRFPQGAVLVTSQALPAWSSLLHRAAAVVTEHGSVASHLANVAREFGVPALFGVVGAKQSLKNGELVTVDADGRSIYAGRVESLLAQSEPKKNLMQGSPVYKVLGEVAQQIMPLTLLDPDAPEFNPKYCMTFHDITRFAHEKSVHEMFNFGKEHQFSERASKQLVCEVPMQWWIINLDDGFREDVEGKYVELDNIVSIPMLALWEGITAVTWKGPPPVDTRGFLSVLAQATTDRALDPASSSQYANRNYFMISKNFCSLTSRFGFHFSVVETLVSDRPRENYVSFQFKGGAADYARRVRRAHFVGDILSELDFRVEIKEDAVFARLEGRDQDFMCERLKGLGYLTIHTRQLDMIMSDQASARSYWTKIRQDLNKIIGTK
ncbi:MAG: pyruvate, water dikinase [Deltaproteobacteria bacterium]|nr:pyruvate, water dikinase [Deltaproteobacteria bacterium]